MVQRAEDKEKVCKAFFKMAILNLDTLQPYKCSLALLKSFESAWWRSATAFFSLKTPCHLHSDAAEFFITQHRARHMPCVCHAIIERTGQRSDWLADICFQQLMWLKKTTEVSSAAARYAAMHQISIQCNVCTLQLEHHRDSFSEQQA